MNLVFVEVGYSVHDHEREGSAKVDSLVHDKGHDAGGEYIVLHVGVPRSPGLLEEVEVYIVLSDLIEVVRVGDR